MMDAFYPVSFSSNIIHKAHFVSSSIWEANLVSMVLQICTNKEMNSYPVKYASVKHVE